MSLLDDFDPTAGRQYFKAETHPAMELAAKDQAFRCLLDFSKAPLWRVTAVPEPEGTVRVELFDLRFGTPNDPGFVSSGLVNGGKISETKFEFASPKLRR